MEPENMDNSDDMENEQLYTISVICDGALDEEEYADYIEDAEEAMDSFIESVIKDYRDGAIDKRVETEISVYDTFECQNVRNWKSIDHMDEIFGDANTP